MSKRPNGRALQLALVAVLVVPAAISLLWPEDDDDAEPAAAVSYDRVFQGLCASSAAAAEGDLDRAYGVFLRESHGGLHTLAAKLSDRGRRVLAGRLLETKAAVETTLPAQDPEAEKDLRLLIDATATGLSVVDGTDQPRCADAKDQP